MDAPASSTETITRVVTTIDDRPASERAVPVAVALARLSGAAVELLSVDPVGLPAGLSHHRLEEVSRLVPADVTVETTVVPTTGSVGVAVAELERSPGSLLCIATRGRGGLKALALGSVTAQVVAHTRLPVLAVGPRCGSDGRTDLDAPAVVALDGGPLDAGVLAAAALWSRSTSAPLLVMSAITTPSEPAAWVDADRVLRSAEGRLTKLGLTVSTTLVAAADVDDGILGALGRPGCIVVGSHRRGPLGRTVLGSTASRVVQRAASPVLVAAAGAPGGAGAR